MRKKTKPLNLAIQEARQASGLSQQQLADRIGVHRTFIAKLETAASDGQNPSLMVMLSLAVVLKKTWFAGDLADLADDRRRELKRAAIGLKSAAVKKKSSAAKS